MNDKQIIKIKQKNLISIFYFYINNYLIDKINSLHKKYKNYNICITEIDFNLYQGELDIFFSPAFYFSKGNVNDIIYGDDLNIIETKIKEYIGGL